MKKIGVVILAILLTILLLIATINDVSCSRKKSNNSSISETSKTNVIINEKQLENSEIIKDPIVDVPIATVSPTPTITVIVTPTIVLDSPSNDTVVVPKEIERKNYVEVDINTIPYSNEYNTVKTKLTARKTFTDGVQIFYVLVLTPIEKIKSLEAFNYYVSYETFNSCTLGSTFMVEYELFDNNILSINNLKKLEN